MRALFAKRPPFSRFRREYLDDEAFRQFQEQLLADPPAGEVRKVRFPDSRRQKGKGRTARHLLLLAPGRVVLAVHPR